MSFTSFCSNALRSSSLSLGGACLALVGLLAGCGGGGGGGAAPSPTTSVPTQASALAQKYAGTWQGCLWMEATAIQGRNSWHRVTYVLTPTGGDVLKLESTEARFVTDDCSGDTPTGTLTEKASLTLDGTTLPVPDPGGVVDADRGILVSQDLRVHGDIRLTRGGGIGIPTQLGVGVVDGVMRLTRITAVGAPVEGFIVGQLTRQP